MIGLIFIGDIKYCPYLERYSKILDEENIEYDIIYWDRENSNKLYPDNYISYVKKSELNKKVHNKLFDFIGYKFWLNNILSNKKYHKLILLSTLSGFLVFEFLINKKMKNNYIFDIRDYSYEHNKIFKIIENYIIKNSFFTCISSEGFKSFLSKKFDYVNVHNFNKKFIKEDNFFYKKNKNETLNLVWLGSIRYFEHQKKIIDKLKNDNRFNLFYHGTGPELDIYESYCNKLNIKNVFFTGEYKNDDKSKLLFKADIINNSYMTRKIMEVKHAISNKFYDGIIYKIPQLVETNTYKATKVTENGLGISISPDDINFANNLFEYYHQINTAQFVNNCKKELDEIIKDDINFDNKIREFIK